MRAEVLVGLLTAALFRKGEPKQARHAGAQGLDNAILIGLALVACRTDTLLDATHPQRTVGVRQVRSHSTQRNA